MTRTSRIPHQHNKRRGPLRRLRARLNPYIASGVEPDRAPQDFGDRSRRYQTEYRNHDGRRSDHKFHRSRRKSMRAIEAVTGIPASPEAASVVLTDFPAYPARAIYLQRIEGRAEAGTWIRLVEGPPGRRPYSVRTRILEATQGPGWRGPRGSRGHRGCRRPFSPELMSSFSPLFPAAERG